jgi:type III pantothenate kinase
MLLAISVGNTNTAFGFWMDRWLHIGRAPTDGVTLVHAYEDICRQAGISVNPDQVLCANVVAGMQSPLAEFSQRHLDCPIRFLTSRNAGIAIDYDPPESVGADRLANAVAVKVKYGFPAIVVDIGTAVTLDVVDAAGAFGGGCILQGPGLAAEALAAKTGLPKIKPAVPGLTIGKSTIQCLQSGIVFGCAGAVSELIARVAEDLGGDERIVAAGGWAKTVAPLCPGIESVDETLTLDGLLLAFGHDLGV